MGLSRTVTAFASNIEFDPALRIVIGARAVATGTELEIRSGLPILVVREPPVAAALIRLPLFLLDAPLRGNTDLLTLHFANEALLPAMADNPFDISQFKIAHRTGLAKIGENGSVGSLGYRGSDHLVVGRILPVVVMRLVALGTL